MHRMRFLLVLTAAFLLPAATIAQPIFRCGNTYSQEACKGGKVVEDKTTTLHSGYSGSTVYLCKGHGGGLFWSSANAASTTLFSNARKPCPPACPGIKKWPRPKPNGAKPSAIPKPLRLSIKTALPSLPNPAKSKPATRWKNASKLWIVWDAQAASTTTWIGYGGSVRWLGMSNIEFAARYVCYTAYFYWSYIHRTIYSITH